jgi:hypothetical protein
MGAGIGSPYGARLVHQGAHKLLIQQHAVLDGEFTPPVQEWTQLAHPLGSSPASLVDVRRPGESSV